MMTNSLMLGGLYLLMAVMLVLGALMSRREPIARALTMALAWIAIFAGGFVVFTFRDDLGYVAQIRIVPAVIVHAFLIGVVSAVIAGIFPSLRIARTAPVEALRRAV